MTDLSNQKISFVIKTYNEEKKIAACIESILAAIKEISNPWEIVVADSVSADKTVEIASHYPVKIVQFVNASERGCGAGVQLGFQHSQGELIYFLDGDMLLSTGFLPAALAELAGNPALAGVSGSLREIAIRNEFDQHRVRSGASTASGFQAWLNGGGLYRRQAISEAGGYAANRNLKGWEEAELGMRLGAAGWKLKRISDTAVLHDGHAASTWKLLWRHWKSGRLMSNGVLLRESLGQPWFWKAIILLIHPILIITWWAAVITFLVNATISNNTENFLYSLTITSLALALALSILKKSPITALKSFLIWHIHAAAIIVGFFNEKPYNSLSSIDSRIVFDTTNK